MSTFSDLLKDPKISAILDELRPALPILQSMADDLAQTTLLNLLQGDRATAILELRQNATEEQWSAFCESAIYQGRAEALKALMDRDNILQFVVQLLFGLVKAAIA